jgi:hypothetical protein
MFAFAVDLPHGFASLDVPKLQAALTPVEVQAFLDANAVIELGVAGPIPREISLSILRTWNGLCRLPRTGAPEDALFAVT